MLVIMLLKNIIVNSLEIANAIISINPFSTAQLNFQRKTQLRT